MRLIGHDRLIDSEIPVPGALAADSPRGMGAELSIRLLPQPAHSGEQPIYRLDGSTLVFAPPGVATFRCRPDEILVSPLAGADPERVAALLIATAIPATLWMLGDFVLHAAAVRPAGHEQAVALASASGGGKSSLAAALVERGAALVADDTLRISRSSAVPMASGLPGGWFAPAAADAPRDFCRAPPGGSVRRCPLGSIVILCDDGPADAPARVDPVAAVEHLLANRHRPRIPALLGRHLETLRFCSFLAEAVPLYIWRGWRGAEAFGDRASAALMRCLA
jgi:hypothetical protein